MNSRHLRRGRQVIRFGIAQNYEESMNATDAGLLRVVNARVRISPLLQFLYTILAALLQFVQVAELNGLRRASLCASGDESGLLPVV